MAGYRPSGGSCCTWKQPWLPPSRKTLHTGDAEHSSLRCGALLEGLAELQRGEGRLQGWAEQGWAGPDSTGTSRSMLGGGLFFLSQQ